jgi:hypothetical protein
MCAVKVRDLLIDRMPEWSGSGLQKRRRPHPSLPARGQGYRIWLRPPGCASWRNIVACHSGRASRVLPGEREPESSNQSGSYIHAGRGLPGRQPICDSPPQKSRRREGRVGSGFQAPVARAERHRSSKSADAGSNPAWSSTRSGGPVPDTWVTVYSGDMGNTFAPKGFSRGSRAFPAEGIRAGKTLTWPNCGLLVVPGSLRACC